MIKANHNPLVVGFFRLYTRIKMRKDFNKIIINSNINTNNKAVLLIANHISWWDGFWTLFLSDSVFHKKFHFMMLEAELKKRWLFSYSGGFSIARNSRSIVESLNYCADLLKNKNNLVLMFPQGKMHSIYNDKLQFNKGIEKIISSSNNEHCIVFLATMIEYFDHPKPDVYFYLEEFKGKDYSVTEIETEYNDFIQNKVALHKQLYL